MNPIDAAFARLREDGRKAFMPFLTAGDPDLAATRDLLLDFSAEGCDLCEVGVPYSDPIADGPVIQASYSRALEKKIKVGEVFDMLAKTTPELACPAVTMVSYSIIHRWKPDAFLDRAQAAGVHGAIVPDLLVEEAKELAEKCAARDFKLISLVTPTTSRERTQRILDVCTGFVYYVSVTGITGERTELPATLLDNVGWLKEQTDLPICIGFGISKPEHIRRLAPVADGFIVGSAIVRRVEENLTQPRDVLRSKIRGYIREMIAAAKEPVGSAG